MDAWIIVNGPVETVDPRDLGADVEGWAWTIRRGGDERKVTVLLSRTARWSTQDGKFHLEDARRTRGRNYLESVLGRDDPPSYLTATEYRQVPGNLIEE